MDPHGHGADRQAEPGCCQLVIDGIGGSRSPPAGDHADPASRRRVHDVGDLCELLCRSTWPYLLLYWQQIRPSPILVRAFWPAGTLVGVTGFEPAASSSRTSCSPNYGGGGAPKGGTQPGWMVVRGGGVAVLRCGTEARRVGKNPGGVSRRDPGLAGPVELEQTTY